MEYLDVVILDLVLYGMLSILPIFGLFVSEKYVKDHPKLLSVLSVIAFVLLFLTNILVPIVHYAAWGENLRPIYTTLLIISCYVFFHVTSNTIAVCMALAVTAVHLIVLIFITYARAVQLERIGSDILYVICLNGFGIYFRLITELIKMRSFLDKRTCLESTTKLKAEKEQREKLMLSIIPKHIMDEVFNQIYDIVKHDNRIFHYPINHPHTSEYANVTILYADIVNYTQMTSTLRSVRLVETLHELFARFDDASRDLNVQRIKFLGDCYYCVAGLPDDSNGDQCPDDHADACVQLGLEMIAIIADVRRQFNLNINMRIGIHSGSIIGGIIGTTKWQFDIWSKDVYIANRMETTGQAGKVHITRQTKDKLKKRYNIDPSDAGTRDPELIRREIECFLISPEPSPQPVSNGSAHDIPDELPLHAAGLARIETANGTISGRRPSQYVRRGSVAPTVNRPSRSTGGSNTRRRITPTTISRRTPFMDNNLARYHERLRITDKQIQEAVHKMPLSKYDQWFNVKEINPLLLIFRNLATELDFIKQPDPLFKYYILSVLVILICMVAIQNFSQTEWNTMLGYISIAFVLLILLPLTWIYGFWHCYRYNIKEEKKNAIVNRVYKFSNAIMENITYRVVIYFAILLLCAGTVFTEMVQCEYFKGSNRTLRDIFIDVLFRSEMGEECMIPWHMTETCALLIIMNFSFLRIHLWLKVLVSLVITALYSYFLWNFAEAYYTNSEPLNHSLNGPAAHVVVIIYLLVTLHFIDRQTDYMHRLDHQWRMQLNEEQEQAHILHQVNYKLLNNILPMHVSEYYTDNDRNEGLYYEEYFENDCVTVMFASIVNYDKEMGDRLLLTYLSGIITAFDQILLNKYDNVVEKIKIANWTYMAATGLDPGKRTSGIGGNRVRVENVIHLLNFAVDIKRKIKRMDKEFQEPKLRIGIAHGPVTAGVVGSKKPLYDIWGDAVNMASRMESTGIMDRIQVMEGTADIIQNYGYSCRFRDHIRVKGRSTNVPTYFVDVDQDDNLVRIQRGIDVDI
ncbi:hypothetical protein Trydic_g23979 [Trypoxylus dichotomus]